MFPQATAAGRIRRHSHCKTDAVMSSKIVKRSVQISGRKTSLSLEEPFWKSLEEIAARRGMSVGELAGKIDRQHSNGNAVNLSSAIRLYVLRYYWHLAAIPSPRPNNPSHQPVTEAFATNPTARRR